MRRFLLALTVCLAIPAAALAIAPARITIVAVFDPITYGETTYINGQLLSDPQSDQANQLVALEQAPPPFTEWTPVLQTTTDYAGYYSFKVVRASQTMQYRTSSQGTPSEQAVQVSLAPKITLRAEPAGRTSIRYRGTFGPALPGQSVAIQRRDRSRWTTIANARLRNGRTFTGRVRTRRGVILRAFFATDGFRLDGYSKAILALPRTSAGGATASRGGPAAAGRR